MDKQILHLDQNSTEVLRSRDAEQRLNRYYGLAPKEYEVQLSKYGINVRICAYGEETNPPVLIIPGNTGDGYPFIPLLPHLSGMRVFLLNRPGGGLSEGFDHRTADFRRLAIDTITEVLDYFEIERLPIIAHSMGGHWSLWYSMENPNRVERLVLLGAPGNVLDCRPPFVLRLTSVHGLNSCLFAAIMPKHPDTALRGLSFLGHSDESLARLPREMAECYYYFQQLPHYKISSLSLMEKTNTLLGSKRDIRIGASELGRITLPVMLLWGSCDPFGDVSKGERIAAALPDAAFHVIPSGGHLPWLDDTAQCGLDIIDFLLNNGTRGGT